MLESLIVKCGCCNGIGKIYVYRLTTFGIEDCSNCGGFGEYLNAGLFVISFKKIDELPKVKYKS